MSVNLPSLDQTTPDDPVRLIPEFDRARTVDIDHFGAETEQGMARIEAATTDRYDRASVKVHAADSKEADL